MTEIMFIYDTRGGRGVGGEWVLGISSDGND